MSFDADRSGNLRTLLEFLAQLILVNLLWFFVSALGLGIFTLAPATIAMYTLLYRHMRGSAAPTVQGFFGVLKREYWKSQKVFFSVILAGSVLAVDLHYFYVSYLQQPSLLHGCGLFVSLFLVTVYCLSLTQIGPVCIYFPDLSALRTLKYAVLFSLGFLFHSLLIVLLLALSLALILFFPRLWVLVPTILMALNTYLSLLLVHGKYSALN
ncbi:MAG: YesL family protein [Bacillota bacterium]|jgi:uncharacterized membrane protein YesL|nr:YesL family protein [Bacillota bacterium]